MGQKLSKNHRGNRRTRRKKEKQKRKTAQVGQQSCCSGSGYCAGDVYWNEFLGGAGPGGRVAGCVSEYIRFEWKEIYDS